MQKFKLLPITVAVAASLASLSSFAADTDIEALEKRIQELESKVVDIDYVNDQQPAVLTAETKVPEGIVFSGYARYGAHYKSGDERYVDIGTTGRSVGRLGNEANGGEVQLAKLFQADNGAIWDVVFMADHWEADAWADDGGLSMKKMYAGVTNVFESQPELYMWAGRDFHQRPQQGLNDYFWMTHDGQGAGFNNLDFGGAKLDMGFVGQVKGGLVNDNGRYAITSKLHSINAGIGQLDLYANYGFASDEADSDVAGDPKVSDETAYLVGATLGLGESNKLVVKYGDGADSSVFDLKGDYQTLYASVEGSYAASDNFIIDYLVSYKDNSGSDLDRENTEYAGIVRPQYQWDDVHSTWLEAGYGMVDYDDDGEENAWKVTLSQNVSLGGLPWSRPMLRFYTTVGDVETKGNTVKTTNVDTLSFGAMFEAWW
ncbi:Maltoporin (maltose/maltodextrin high-affinity receptor, phage lambda receptor protein) [Vibrio chagasii]|uniref:ABC transporter: Maltoporin n=1 Tax=Vibrio coralliirubri TaxID=1516159 RepID=A0AA86XDI3_9VIBR|nr:carbohydrate porin [Vibrio coralliirubri]CAH6863306.1 Maltoporin (maltose/maltodextrin high-affinity receptor, phage lambda receptor protein) [Vibrio chagasii]CAH7262284.1 Maltoporin (maltose/maltodextrin high-affinity receptor, phage lambda receptor protein) [Vibrio chagasii]CAH7291840.1 Maltoporin (maltose/maltodextrin high-affinity receptor, phage lambda receptor protein) [Vibrio chagasii]CAH7441974.1 Maltoporin (maltose/maltodextrin high-affinity receptor, phage lambda receptor protein) 